MGEVSGDYQRGYERGWKDGHNSGVSDERAKSTVGEAGAVFGFMAWLTTRYAESGPFSRYIEANQAAELADEFCAMQGWEVDDERYPKNLVQFPNDVPEGADEAYLASIAPAALAEPS